MMASLRVLMMNKETLSNMKEMRKTWVTCDHMDKENILSSAIDITLLLKLFIFILFFF